MKTHWVKIKVDNNYIIGRISGMITALTYDEENERMGVRSKPCYTDDDEQFLWKLIKFEATEEEFDLLKKVINKSYEGYCLFG